MNSKKLLHSVVFVDSTLVNTIAESLRDVLDPLSSLLPARLDHSSSSPTSRRLMYHDAERKERERDRETLLVLLFNSTPYKQKRKEKRKKKINETNAQVSFFFLGVQLCLEM